MRLARFARLSPIFVGLVAAGCASTGAAPEAVPDAGPGAASEPEAAAAFERLRGLAGSWRGGFGMGEGKGTAVVEYRVTSGGTAVEEVLFKGTPHEMVTMYHRDGPRLLLTHYCAAGNQPTMVLLPGGDPAELRFSFVRGTNMATPGDGHMHEAVLDLSKPERIRAVWTFWQDGRAGEKAVIDVERAK